MSSVLVVCCKLQVVWPVIAEISHGGAGRLHAALSAGRPANFLTVWLPASAERSLEIFIITIIITALR